MDAVKILRKSKNLIYFEYINIQYGLYNINIQYGLSLCFPLFCKKKVIEMENKEPKK